MKRRSVGVRDTSLGNVRQQFRFVANNGKQSSRIELLAIIRLANRANLKNEKAKSNSTVLIGNFNSLSKRRGNLFHRRKNGIAKWQTTSTSQPSPRRSGRRMQADTSRFVPTASRSATIRQELRSISANNPKIDTSSERSIPASLRNTCIRANVMR